MTKIVLPEGYGKSVKKGGGRPKELTFSSSMEDTIFNMVSAYNKQYPDNRTELSIAKKVVKRGLDAGNSDTGLVRLRNFLLKKTGESNSRYTDDDDLLTKK